MFRFCVGNNLIGAFTNIFVLFARLSLWFMTDIISTCCLDAVIITATRISKKFFNSIFCFFCGFWVNVAKFVCVCLEGFICSVGFFVVLQPFISQSTVNKDKKPKGFRQFKSSVQYERQWFVLLFGVCNVAETCMHHELSLLGVFFFF